MLVFAICLLRFSVLFGVLFQLSTWIPSIKRVGRKFTFNNHVEMLLCFVAVQCFVQCFVSTLNLDSVNNEDQKEVDVQE